MKIIFLKLEKSKAKDGLLTNRNFYFFTDNDNVKTLNRVLLFIKRNEPTKNVNIVAEVKNEKNVAKSLQSVMEVLNPAYHDLYVQFIEEQRRFGPEKIEELSNR